ncbi:uncharacterized protein J4E78_001046 [Alternaria triticimaculans]|uniref:uncharacterized protein n=1 Tax=Alternaria triticimaculans TaxID=297637 RepID=UPI0020C3BA30|nr:uncharacterized protein J4E78_001046 [Alternaria triticimaculans]KAI4672545.1 hypothetical protein J4E78_001046 [Alternaria triticimaculans]
MAPTGLTFKDVQTWALRDFPEQFRQLPDAKAFHVQFNIVRGYNHDNDFKSLVIGSTRTKTGKPADVLAWLAGSRIQLGYIGKNRKGEQQIRHMVFAEENISWWRFKFPFSVILPTQGGTEIACFNAMLRYYFLANGWSKGVIDDSDVFHRFVSRFPHACRAIANAITQRPEPVPTPSVTVFPPGAGSVLAAPANYQFHSCGDQIVALDEANDADERDGSGLRNKLFDLNIRLMIAEGLARDAEIAARTAQEEAQLWRKRYEEAESYRIKYEEMRSHFGLPE